MCMDTVNLHLADSVWRTSVFGAAPDSLNIVMSGPKQMRWNDMGEGAIAPWTSDKRHFAFRWRLPNWVKAKICFWFRMGEAVWLMIF